ncbi:flippase-like domain-containing protein [Candidatus Nomurabacteria bacterium]|nr:flippase-like domain-containing protein [Candidatus Nomurabacteria bacterium]
MKNFLRKNWKAILNAVTIVLLGAAIYFVRKDVGSVLSDFAKINAIALILMIPLQLLNYSAYAHMYQDLLGMLGRRQPLKRMYKIALELNFVNHVFPSGGVSGFSYFTARLKPYGVSTSQSTLTQTLRFILTFASFVILLFIGLFMLALGGSASNMTILITCSLAFLTVFVIVVGMYVISNKKRIHSFTQTLTIYVNKLIHVIRPKHPETINLKRVEKVFNETHDNYLLLKEKFPAMKSPFFYSILANVTELATIYVVYIAYGQFVNPGAVIIAYALANFAGLIAVLPGGIGVYEGLMTAVLISAGVPAGLAISVTVMYRVINMALSLPVGYYFYHKAIDKLG